MRDCTLSLSVIISENQKFIDSRMILQMSLVDMVSNFEVENENFENFFKTSLVDHGSVTTQLQSSIPSYSTLLTHLSPPPRPRIVQTVIYQSFLS